MGQEVLNDSIDGHLRDALTNFKELSIALEGLVKLGGIGLEDAFKVNASLAIAKHQLEYNKLLETRNL